MRNIYILFLCLFTFVFIYTPPLHFIPVQIDLFIYAITFYLVLSQRINILGFLGTPGLNKSFHCNLVLLSYSILLTLLVPPSIGLMDLNPVKIVRLLIEVFGIPYVIISVYFKKGLSRKKIVDVLLWIAIIQSYIAILMIFVPSVKSFVTTSILRFDTANKLSFQSLLDERVFGIGSEYLFGLPIFQAMMACVYINVTKEKRFFFLFNLLCLIGSAIFCARSSLFVFLCYFLYYFVNRFKTHVVSSILMMGLISGIVYSIYIYLINIEGIIAIEHFNRAFNGQYQGYDSLFDTMLFFPTDLLTWLFGNGSYVFFDKKRASDLGYVNDIFYGGVFYLSLEILAMYYLYKEAQKANYLYSVLPLLFLSLLVLNYKGSVYSAKDYMKGIMLLYYTVVLKYQTKDIKYLA